LFIILYICEKPTDNEFAKGVVSVLTAVAIDPRRHSPSAQLISAWGAVLVPLIGVLALLSWTALSAAETRSGRWEGVLHLPREELQLIVDLDRAAAGQWIGSVIIPALHIKGAAVSDIVASDSALSFSIQEALGIPHEEQATFSGTARGDTLVAGTFKMAGNSAPFERTRTGPPQVELPPKSTPIDENLAGTWEGTYTLKDGRDRHVTLTLESHGKAAGTATLLIVGKEPHNFPIDLVTVEGTFVTIESLRVPVKIEGRLHQSAAEFVAVMDQGPIEVPLVLRRKGKGTP
jgi:hypothetical protein